MDLVLPADVWFEIARHIVAEAKSIIVNTKTDKYYYEIQYSYKLYRSYIKAMQTLIIPFNGICATARSVWPRVYEDSKNIDDYIMFKVQKTANVSEIEAKITYLIFDFNIVFSYKEVQSFQDFIMSEIYIFRILYSTNITSINTKLLYGGSNESSIILKRVPHIECSIYSLVEKSHKKLIWKGYILKNNEKNLQEIIKLKELGKCFEINDFLFLKEDNDSNRRTAYLAELSLRKFIEEIRPILPNP